MVGCLFSVCWLLWCRFVFLVSGLVGLSSGVVGSLVNLCGGFVGFGGLCVFCALSFWVGWWLSCALVWCGLRMI